MSLNTPSRTRQQVTRQIIAALEAGTVPWRRPWRIGLAPLGRFRSIVSRKPLADVHPLLLALHSMAHGFRSRWYGAAKQWKDTAEAKVKEHSHVGP